ncbi:hypothetical protein HYW83_03815 [Candidatus Peregrinibacteria bacterium]|nr:hypothetical protein [Candidatus Peregrinibacteria bacterium]
MTLKLIPVEHSGTNIGNHNGRKQKSFNPADRMRKNSKGDSGGLKNICLRLVRFINRGSKFTYEQIDELIMALQRSILSLQKKKQEIMRRKKG